VSHIGDTNKKVSDTPRMKAAQMASLEPMTGDVYRVGCDIERELYEAKELIKRLEVAAWKNYNNAHKEKEAKP
jgi:hypothetical protein